MYVLSDRSLKASDTVPCSVKTYLPFANEELQRSDASRVKVVHSAYVQLLGWSATGREL